MSFRRRVLVVAAALAGTGAALVLLAHAPPIRRAVLRHVIPVVEQQYGLRLDASRLDYSLAALRMGLADVRLAAPGSVDEPFFSAEYVSVTLARTSLIGTIAFDDIAATNARVLVRRRSDGSTNLPSPAGTPDDDPPPLRVNRIDAPQIAVDLRDEQEARFLWIPSLAVRLTPDGGFVRLAREAELHTETQITSVNRLDGDVAFDGRALRVRNLHLELNELDAQLDGSLTIIARDPSVDVRMRGTGDATRLARWVVLNGDLPRGDIAFDASLAGRLDTLDTRVRITSDRLAVGSITTTRLLVRAHIVPERTEIEELRFGFEGGEVTATATLPFASDADGRLEGSWIGLDAASVTRLLAPDAAILPSGAISGRVDAQGPGLDPLAWSAVAGVKVASRANARGKMAFAGDARIALDNRRWRLTGRQILGGVVPTTFALGGRLPGDSGPNDEVAGTVQIGTTDLQALADLLRTTGLADVPEDTVDTGTLEGELRLAGRMADLQIDGRASVRDLRGSHVGVASLEAAVSGRPSEPRLGFAIDAPHAVVAGQTVADLRVVGQLGPEVLDLEVMSVRQPSGTGVVMADGAYSLRTRRYVAAVEGRDWQLVPTADQPLAGLVALRFAGEGSIDAPRGLGELTICGAVWDGRALGPVEATIAVEGRAATIQASAREFAARADARVGLDAPYPAAIELRAEKLSLARVLEGIETAAAVSGETTVVARAELPLEAWRTGSATLEIQSLHAHAGDLAIRLAEPARLRYEGERVYVDRLEAEAGDTRISASGELPARLKPDTTYGATGIIVTATGDVAEVARAAAATGLVDVPVTGGSGPVALLARVTGALEAPVVAADLEVGPGSIVLEGLPPISNLRVRAHAEEGWIELREGLASYQNADLTVTGRAPLSLLTSDRAPNASAPSAASDERAVVRARAANLTPAVLAAFVDLDTADEIEGSIDATLDAAASRLDLAALTGELRIDRFDLRIADLPVTQRVPTRIVARDGFARVEAWEWAGQGATLSVRGQVRLEDRQAAVLANGTVDLRVLTPFVRGAGFSIAGSIEPRLSITGGIDDPRVDGDLILSGGEIRVADPRVLISDLAARTIVTRTTARIDSISGSVNGGGLTGSGQVEYTPEAGVEVQLSALVSGVALEFPQGLRSELDADLSLNADGSAGRLAGTVTVLRSTYREPMAVVTGLLTGLRTQRIAAASESSPMLDTLALDVRVLTDEDVIVANNYARVQLGGDLRIIGTASAPAVSGRAELREGGQLFVGRNVYTVNFGTIDFANPVAIEPVLNVEASTRAGGEDIEVTITGAAEAPTVALSSPSNPGLGQAELASLLLTGRRLEDLAPGDAAFVGTQVLGNFSAEVLGFASRAVGLDTLRLGGVEGTAVRRDPTEVATELDPTTRLTFGKSIGSDVDVTFSQSLRDGDAQTWILDYLPARGLELRLVSDDDDLRTYGFRHDVSLGGVPRQPRPGRDQGPQELRVSSVDVAGDIALPERRVRDALTLVPGDRFDFAQWLTDRDRLEALYRSAGYLTARIGSRRTNTPAAVALTYEISAGPRTTIDVIGVSADSALAAQLETAWAQSVFDDFLLEEAAQIVRARLARDGYLRPSIEARLSEDGQVKRLTMTVDRGVRSTTTAVRIEGIGQTSLVDAIVAHLEARGVVKGGVSDPAVVEREVTTFLRTRGFLGARVVAGMPTFDGAAAVLPVTVDAGSAYSVAGVAFEGSAGLSEDDLRQAAALEAGMPYDPALVEAARDRLVALSRREGFANAEVAATPDVRPDTAAVDVRFAVTPGPRQTLGDVVVSGNRAIDADVIVRAIGLERGSPLRADDVLQARTRVFDTGLFRRIDIASEPMEPTERRRLRVAVEEWPTVRLRYGLVVAEERPEDNPEGRELVPGISADLTRRTLFGRAIAVGGAADWQRRERRGRAFLNAPTFMGLPIESSLVAERSREEFEAVTLVTNRSSVTWEQRTRVARSLSLSYSYTFERNHTFDTKPPDPFSPAFDISINIARVNAAGAWDTRDDPADSTRGLLASWSFETAPEIVGSDIRFVRQLWQAYYFRPWRQVVLSSAARAGVVVPLGGQELILSERFFAGGSRTVRGVAEGALGPRDVFDFPAGGRMLVVLNQEARVPIYRWVRGVAFVDAGNVFAHVRDASLTGLVGAVGVGLRLATPVALLRADYARPVWGTALKTGRWTFGIGQAF